MKRYAVTEDELEQEAFKKQISQHVSFVKEAWEQERLQRGMVFIDGTLAGVETGSVAEELGLQKGDKLLAVDGKRIFTWIEAFQLFENSPNEHHAALVIRNGQYFPIAFRLKPQPSENSKLGAPVAKVFGHQIIQAYGEGPMMERHVGIVEAFKRALERTGDLIWMTLKSLWMLLSFQVPVSQLGGPIMIFGVAGQAVTQGLAFYIYVMSLISVNLGLLNLLPIPVLDGGHLLMFGIEAVQRKPLSLKTRQLAMQIGLMFILVLTVVALFNDFSRLFS